MSVFTSGNCRVEWYPPRLLGTWEVTITNGQDPEDGEGVWVLKHTKDFGSSTDLPSIIDDVDQVVQQNETVDVTET